MISSSLSHKTQKLWNNFTVIITIYNLKVLIMSILIMSNDSCMQGCCPQGQSSSLRTAWIQNSLALASNAVASNTLGNCDNVSVLSEMILVLL